MALLGPALIAGVMLLAGIVLLVRGLIGRAIDDHPICRKCGFDLFGRPTGSTKCPECGTELSISNAIRIGHRKKRRPLIFAGLFLILPLLAGLSIWSIGSFSQIKWIEYEPYWYVMRQAKSNVPPERDPALVELARRIQAGELSDERIASIVDMSLDQQADLTKTWVPRFGDIVEKAQLAGKLPADKWAQYLANSVQYKLIARAEVRRGDDVPIRVATLPARVGGGLNAFVQQRLVVLSNDLAFSAQFEGSSTGSGISAGGGGYSSSTVRLDPKRVAKVPDGPQALRIRVKLEFFNSYSTTNHPSLATKSVDLETTWKLVPADAPTVKVIDDPSLKDAVEKSIRAISVSVSPSGGGVSLQVQLAFSAVPAPLAYQVFVRAGGHEWSLGSVNLNAGQSTSWGLSAHSSWGLSAQTKNLDADKVDVIFRPDVKTALNSTDLTKYWNGEIIFKDIKVERPKPTTTAGG